jgi:SAM-dependent methyltransferase
VSGEHPITGSENGSRTDPTGYPEPSTSVASETLYDWLAGYGFARRYVEGKVLANIGLGALGYGSHLLSQTAGHVVGLTRSTEVADLASRAHPAPNVEYKKIDLPSIPYSDGHFDVVVALGALEELDQPEELVMEARRVLKLDGVLIVSALDRRALLETNPEGDGRRRGMYVPEFRSLLDQHFGRVRIFRQGAVAGGFVFPEAEDTTGASVESAPSSAIVPSVGPEPPTTRSVLAVCSGTETPEDEELAEQDRPYLLLDRERRVFDEREDLAGDVELLRSEIGRMQETEVQAFQDTYRLLFSEIAFLRAQVRRYEARARKIERASEASTKQIESGSEAQYKARIQALQDHIRDIENSATWRVFEPYRQLRIRLDAARKGKRDK